MTFSRREKVVEMKKEMKKPIQNRKEEMESTTNILWMIPKDSERHLLNILLYF